MGEVLAVPLLSDPFHANPTQVENQNVVSLPKRSRTTELDRELEKRW